MVTLPKIMAMATMALVGSAAAAGPGASHLPFGGGLYPEPIALAATWDPALVTAIATLTARDAPSGGASFVRVPLAVARDPRLGRIERTFGEDPMLVAEMGVAAVKAIQAAGVSAAVGPFAGPEPPASGTDVIAAPIAERELRNVYLPPFEAAIARAGVKAIVAGRNEVDGIPSHANRWLLRDVLRGEWRYAGAIIGDARGIDDLHNAYRLAPDAAGAESIAREAGIEGTVGPAVVGRSSEEARRIALRAAQRAIVLLENRGALPIALSIEGRPVKIAIVDQINSGLADAIRALDHGRIEIVDRTTAGVERLIVVAGDDLAAAEAAIAGASKPVVIVLAGQQPGVSVGLSQRADAVVAAWSLGPSGAAAIAAVLLGEVNPGGKLPMTIARNAGQWPITYDAKPSARRGYLFDTTEPLYAFGHGLSYSTFEVGAPVLAKTTIGPAQSVEVSVDVRNTSARAGDETVQVYVHDKVASTTRPVKSLAAFRRVTLAAGETRTLTFTIEPAAFALWDASMRRVVEPGEFEIFAGSSSSQLKSATLTIAATP
jgi:beta-glucosidase